MPQPPLNPIPGLIQSQLDTARWTSTKVNRFAQSWPVGEFESSPGWHIAGRTSSHKDSKEPVLRGCFPSGGLRKIGSMKMRPTIYWLNRPWPGGWASRRGQGAADWLVVDVEAKAPGRSPFVISTWQEEELPRFGIGGGSERNTRSGPGFREHSYPGSAATLRGNRVNCLKHHVDAGV